MITNKTIVLAVVAIRDKLYDLNNRKKECDKHLNSKALSSESKEFWTQHSLDLDVRIQEYTKAEAELMQG
jgi:hypothetical protein